MEHQTEEAAQDTEAADQVLETLIEQPPEILAEFIQNPWTEAAVIITIGLVLAKLAEVFICTVVSRLMKATDNKLDDLVVQLLHKPLFTSFALMGLIIASNSLKVQLGETALAATGAILKTLIILSWLRFFMRSSGAILESMGRNPDYFAFAQKDTVPLMRNLATVFLLLAGAYAILIAWDIDVTGLVASAGIVGLALSFAAQDTLSHLFAGVAILADRPYRIGDFIVLDTGERGQVTAIGLRSTRLMTRDDVEVSIPNGVMGGAKIVNESGGHDTKFRVRATVGVAYGSDVKHVLEILESIARNNEELCDEPAPRARFRAFGDLRVHEMNCEIYRRFNAEGVTIPFPQQDLWVRELPVNDE